MKVTGENTRIRIHKSEYGSADPDPYGTKISWNRNTAINIHLMNVSTFRNCFGKIGTGTVANYFNGRWSTTGKIFGLTLLTGGEEEEEDEETGSERGEESVEVPVLVLPDSLKERLEADMKAILSK